jgi:hypothetical protein
MELLMLFCLLFVSAILLLAPQLILSLFFQLPLLVPFDCVANVLVHLDTVASASCASLLGHTGINSTPCGSFSNIPAADAAAAGGTLRHGSGGRSG